MNYVKHLANIYLNLYIKIAIYLISLLLKKDIHFYNKDIPDTAVIYWVKVIRHIFGSMDIKRE
ncbi:hypothetical protein [Plasmodium yoelii yoelii]|uniref:Uncharacterized protein n=1 Tax=Plasmodium yoelii yoelii TaxID=73239 RepID=Q7RLM0_PLAYO|nr:hypothetical protein [Plasmodium yoelii yoelii]